MNPGANSSNEVKLQGCGRHSCQQSCGRFGNNKGRRIFRFSGLVLANVGGVYCFTSVEAISIVIMNPLVPLNSNGLAPVL